MRLNKERKSRLFRELCNDSKTCRKQRFHFRWFYLSTFKIRSMLIINYTNIIQLKQWKKTFILSNLILTMNIRRNLLRQIIIVYYKKHKHASIRLRRKLSKQKKFRNSLSGKVSNNSIQYENLFSNHDLMFIEYSIFQFNFHLKSFLIS